MSSEQTSTLSESDSKLLLSSYSIPFAPERKTGTAAEAVAAADQLGYPVVVKLGGDNIAHKTERGLVRLRLNNSDAVSEAATSLLAAATAADGDVHLLVAPMISGTRELIAGMLVDPQFGPTVMFGIGGTPEGVVAAAALKCMGGEIQARLWPRSDEERDAAIAQGYDLARILLTDDLVQGDNCFFAATGVTDGELLQGVRFTPGLVHTQSLVMRSRSGTVRLIDAQHRLDKISEFSAIDYS